MVSRVLRVHSAGVGGVRADSSPQLGDSYAFVRNWETLNQLDSCTLFLHLVLRQQCRMCRRVLRAQGASAQPRRLGQT